MPEQTSKDFGARFLLMLTKEIIENTEAYKNLKIKKEVKEFIVKEKKELELPGLAEEVKKEGVKEFISGKIKKESEKISEMGKAGLLPELKMIFKPMEKSARMRIPIKKIPPFLRIPEPALPGTVSYIRPIPTSEEIDLGNLNILIKDPLVKIIECNGTNENIIVMGMMGRKPTPIELTSEEIEEIVGKFAAASRIPVHEGLFKAAVGNLVISAVISEITGVKFIIRKISLGF